MAYQNRSWDFDLEEGVLDAGKLHRVVTQPYLRYHSNKSKTLNLGIQLLPYYWIILVLCVVDLLQLPPSPQIFLPVL